MLCGSDRREVTVQGDEEAHKTVQRGQTISAVVVCVCSWVVRVADKSLKKGLSCRGFLF